MCAILLANAMAATLYGLRLSNSVSQAETFAPRRACWITADAPTTKRGRKIGFPIFEILPNLAFLPVEFDFRGQAYPSRKMTTKLEGLWVGYKCRDRVSSDWTHTWN